MMKMILHVHHACYGYIIHSVMKPGLTWPAGNTLFQKKVLPLYLGQVTRVWTLQARGLRSIRAQVWTSIFMPMELK